jgi:hypothetical protein
MLMPIPISENKRSKTTFEFYKLGFQKWTCPYCKQSSQLEESEIRRQFLTYEEGDGDGGTQNVKAILEAKPCHNRLCLRVTVETTLDSIDPSPINPRIAKRIHHHQYPELKNSGPEYPNCVPKILQQELKEAYLICKISAKSSATLSRRCLQWILRDYFQTAPARLVDEIKSIKNHSKISKDLFDALNGIRDIGNVGAHPEDDVNVMVDVQENEAEDILAVIDLLITETYIADDTASKKYQSIQTARNRIKKAKSAPPAASIT